MTWTTPTYVHAQQGSVSTVDYYTWRTMAGHVQLDLTDVSYTNGQRWGEAVIWFSLIDSSGVFWADNVLFSKEWGVATGYRALCFIHPARAVRFRVQTQVEPYIPQEGGDPLCTWTSYVRWDNAS